MLISSNEFIGCKHRFAYPAVNVFIDIDIQVILRNAMLQ